MSEANCPHCGAVLTEAPNCCEAAIEEHSEEMHKRYFDDPLATDDLFYETDLEEYYCYECDREIEECECR